MKNNASYLVIVLLLFISCKKGDAEDSSLLLPPPLKLIATTLPFEFTSNEITFYKDVAYGEFERNKFDIFLPKSNNPTGLAIFIHGGGFTGGDKALSYSDAGFKSFIDYLLSKNIAFASINYRYLESQDQQGVLKPLNDSKRALQFMKYYANDFNIDKNKVVLLGSSAGAGTSLWIGLNNEMSDNTSSDKILRESTRVQGMVCTETQASYDVLEWHNSVFSEYKNQGLDFNTLKNLVTESVLLQFYGVATLEELNSERVSKDRQKLDMISLLSSDDPEFYLSNSNNEYVYPTNSTQLLHHPLHSKILIEMASNKNLAVKAYIPSLNIDTTNGENIANFIIRKLN
jgi:hypothetical protein